MTPRRWPLILSLLLLVFFIHSIAYHFFSVDDSFISYRYARNWADGIGPVYNPGEQVDGYTNFLWVVLLTGMAKIGFDLPFAGAWMGTWFGLLSVALAIWLIRRHPQGRGWLAGSLVALGLGLNSIFNRSMAEGLETALFTCLLLGSMTRLWVESHHPERRPVGGLLVALLTLTRPDGMIFIVLLGGWVVWRLWARGVPNRTIIRWMMWYAVPIVVLVGTWFIWHWWFYGAPVANTFYAKTGGPLDTRLERGTDSLDTLWQTSGSVIFFTAAVLGCFFLARSGAWWSLVGLAALGRIVFHLYSGGSFIGFLRFLIPIVPLIAMTVGVCAAALWRDARLGKLARIPAVLMIAALGVAVMDLPRIPRWYIGSVQNMGYLTSGHIALGKNLAETAPSDAIIAIQDAGAVPFYSGLVTIDIVGLNDAHIAHLEGDLYQKTDVDYVLGRNPTYIVLVSTTLPDKAFTPAKWVDIQFYDDPRFQERYVHTQTFSQGPAYHLVVFHLKQ